MTDTSTGRGDDLRHYTPRPGFPPPHLDDVLDANVAAQLAADRLADTSTGPATTAGFTPTDEDVERWADALGCKPYVKRGGRLQRCEAHGGVWSASGCVVSIRAAAQGERERRAAKVEALEEVIREARERDDVQWYFVERMEFIMSEIKAGR